MTSASCASFADGAERCPDITHGLGCRRHEARVERLLLPVSCRSAPQRCHRQLSAAALYILAVQSLCPTASGENRYDPGRKLPDSSESPEGRYDPGRKLPDSSEWGASGTHGVLHTVGGVV